MRQVDRNTVAAPKSLTDADGAGLTELATAKLHYAQPDASTTGASPDRFVLRQACVRSGPRSR